MGAVSAVAPFLISFTKPPHRDSRRGILSGSLTIPCPRARESSPKTREVSRTCGGTAFFQSGTSGLSQLS